MSGIYIKDMEMPKSCWYCRFELNNMCRATLDRMRVKPCDRHPNCPLVAVPKHGRLIDADVLKKRMIEYGWHHPDSTVHEFLEDDAPTIIESEE